MILEGEWHAAMGSISGQSGIRGVSLQYIVVLYDNPVQHYGDDGRRLQFVVGTEAWCGPVNVIHLPFSVFGVSVNQGGALFIDASDHPIHIGRIVVAIEHLNLIAALDHDTAVAPVLSMVIFRIRRLEFDVQLAIPKILFGGNAPCAGFHREYPIVDLPFGRSSALRLPFGQIGSIKKDDESS